MKNVIRYVSGLAAFAVGVLLSANAAAGFDLSLVKLPDNNDGTYEINVVISPNLTSPTPQKIEMLTYSLEIAPANGYSLDAITGVRFDGARNGVLFSNPLIVREISTLRMKGSVISGAAVAAPQASTVAFTVLLSTNSSNVADIEIRFTDEVGPFSNAFVGEFDNDITDIQAFDDRATLPAFTIIGVPEPSTWILASLGMAGTLIARRRKNRVRSLLID